MKSFEQYSRRDFLRVGGSALLVASSFGASNSRVFSESFESRSAAIPYSSKLRDRLWMWGHGAGSTDDLYNIPKGNKIDMADAIRSMGIPNVCVTRWRGLPAPENDERDGKKPPFDRFLKQFESDSTKRIAWSIADGAPEPFELKKDWAISLLDKTPKLTTFFLDDLFIGNGVLQEGQTELPALASLAQIRALREEIDRLPRRPEIAAVLYSHQLQEAIRPHLELCDVVSFWTWDGADLNALRANFRRYREIMPQKRTLLGVYMWDFGGAQPIDPELMKLQLAAGLELFRQGEVEGFIFHCTPLCDLGLEAVDAAREWIREFGDEEAPM